MAYKDELYARPIGKNNCKKGKEKSRNSRLLIMFKQISRTDILEKTYTQIELLVVLTL